MFLKVWFEEPLHQNCLGTLSKIKTLGPTMGFDTLGGAPEQAF